MYTEKIIFEDDNIRIYACGVYEIKNNRHFEDCYGCISESNIALYGFNKLSQLVQMQEEILQDMDDGIKEFKESENMINGRK